MRYDFRSDVPIVHAWMQEVVAEYLAKHLRSPGEFPKLTRVELAFLCGDGTNPASLYIDLDARPDAEADGDATFGSVSQLERPGWRAFLLPPKGDRQLIATMPDGTVRTTDDETDALCAEALAKLLVAARAAGVFDALPAASGLLLDVTYEGARVWPPYDDEGNGRVEA